MKGILFVILTTLTLIQETPVLKRCYVTQEIQQREEQKHIEKIKAEEERILQEQERIKKETERT